MAHPRTSNSSTVIMGAYGPVVVLCEDQTNGIPVPLGRVRDNFDTLDWDVEDDCPPAE